MNIKTIAACENCRHALDEIKIKHQYKTRTGEGVAFTRGLEITPEFCPFRFVEFASIKYPISSRGNYERSLIFN